LAAAVLGLVALTIALSLYAKRRVRTTAFSQIGALGGTVNTFPDLPGWVPDAAAGFIGNVYGQVEVGFVDVSLTPENVEELSKALHAIGDVDVLSLQGKTVGDEWLRDLRAPRVRVLVLDLTNVTPKGCVILREWKDLAILKLQDNPHVSGKDIRDLRLRVHLT
jgi:hypothetical protein